ncbi:MAG: protoglobin domain-containing protein [Streptosporangiaceae bacterium]
MTTDIPGYAYGDASLARSPVSLEDLELLKTTVMWSEEDDDALRMAGDVLADQTDDILDLWYGFVGSNPHLAAYFAPEGGQPDDRYLQRVRPRFAQWILDTCRRPYDQAWLDYQHEVALRHTPARKNETDDVETVDHVSLRYLVAFIYPISQTVRSFLAKKGHSEQDVERMHQAWTKAVTLQVALWSQPYAPAIW